MVALWINLPTLGSYYSGKVERQKQRLGIYGHLSIILPLGEQLHFPLDSACTPSCNWRK
jgi:hypothetical protein